MPRRHLLLRVANVNPESVTTHTDRVLYSAIGVFILLYFVYATVGGAAFVDASATTRTRGGSGWSARWWRPAWWRTTGPSSGGCRSATST